MHVNLYIQIKTPKRQVHARAHTHEHLYDSMSGQPLSGTCVRSSAEGIWLSQTRTTPRSDSRVFISLAPLGSSSGRSLKWVTCWWDADLLSLYIVNVCECGSVCLLVVLHKRSLCNTENKHPGWQQCFLKIFQTRGTLVISSRPLERTYRREACL